MRLTLGYKFALVMVILAVGPLIALGIKMVQVNRDELQGVVLELHSRTAERVAAALDSHFRFLQRQLVLLLRAQAIPGLRWEDRRAVLETFLKEIPNFASVSLVDDRGRTLVNLAYNPDLEPRPSLPDRAADPAFLGVRSGKEVALGPVYYRGDFPRMNVACRYERGRTLFIVVGLDDLWRTVLGARFRKTGFAYLVDRDGRIVAHPDPARRFRSAAEAPIVKAVLGGQVVGSHESLDERGRPVVGAAAPVRSLGWGVVVQQDQGEAFYSAALIRRQAFGWTAGAAVAAIVLAWVLARGLARPILALVRGAERVAAGDFTHRVEVEASDETRLLADTFNRMVRALEAYSELQIDQIIAEKNKTDAILFSIADGIVMTDFGGRVLLINEQARRFLGLEEADAEKEQRVIWDALADPEIQKAFRNALERPSGWAQELEMIRAEARHVIRAESRVVKTRTGKDLGAVVVLHDVTLEKELEQMKDDFVHSITHDLRNPIASIRGFLGFLQDGSTGPLNEQQQRFIEIIDRSSVRLLGLVNDILDVAKMEAGKFELERGECDLGELANRTAEALSAQAVKARITLTVNAPRGLTVSGDAGLLERTLHNLVGNALKFTPMDGTITVEAHDAGDRVEVSVHDTGEGIPEEALARIFEKFQQAGKKQARKGTGLGLTICRYAVEAHGGQVQVTSKVGEGSTFSFWIPKHAAEVQGAPEVKEASG